MKVENKPLNGATLIQDIEVGECFIYDGELYLKIDGKNLHIKMANVDYFPNASVNLERNFGDKFANGVQVSRVKAKIVLE